MMYKSALATALLASATQAYQFYSKSDCGANPNDPEAFSFNFDVTTEIKPDGGSTCSYLQIDLNDWPKNSAGQYEVYMDQVDIQEDCEIVFFNGSPSDEEVAPYSCKNFYRRVPADNKCVFLTLNPEFGVSSCCGDGCDVPSSDFPGSKRSLPMSPAAKAVRDVTEIKRAAPLQQKRAECSWNSEGKESVISYGTQERVSNEVDCGTSECTEAVAYTVETSTTTSFGVETSVGAAFEIISASVSFSTEYSETESQSFALTYTSTRPAGSRGYVTFSQRYECSPEGSFSGDCASGIPTGIDGAICWPTFVGGAPDGTVQFVQTN